MISLTVHGLVSIGASVDEAFHKTGAAEGDIVYLGRRPGVGHIGNPGPFCEVYVVRNGQLEFLRDFEDGNP